MPRVYPTVALLVLAMLPVTAGAAPAKQCPSLFGNAKSRTTNKHRRSELLYWTQQDKLGVVIAHGSHRWSVPVLVDFLGLDVSVKEGHATVKVEAALAERAGCVAGTYKVGIDAAVGKAAILAVLQQGLLLENDGELQYWGHGRCCQWMMAWGSRYRMVMQVAKNSGSVSPRSPPPRSTPKPKPPRPRPKRNRR